jgi:hypothetical protein
LEKQGMSILFDDTQDPQQHKTSQLPIQDDQDIAEMAPDAAVKPANKADDKANNKTSNEH